MRRVVSVWFPHWPTDRLRRSLPPPETPAPLVTATHDGRRRVIAATDPAAALLGLRQGMAIAQALAIQPGLDIVEAEPETDAVALERLARWCHRLTPLVSIDGPDGLWLDVTGCTHLWDNETTLLRSLLNRLDRDRLQARAAVADTPGAAHALARAAPLSPVVVEPGAQVAAVANLPVSALRLSSDLAATLQRLGFEQISHLARIPRAMLARRFGPLPGLRLDQINGTLMECLAPLPPEQVLQRRTMFLEPLLTAEALTIATARLMDPLCKEMEHSGLGARQLDLLFERVDNQCQAIRVGTVRPSWDAKHLARLLTERIDTVDPGLGIEAMRLVVSLAEPLRWEQQADKASGQDATQVAARLVDRLTNRLGDHVYRVAPLQSFMPERMTRRAGADAAPDAIAAPRPGLSPQCGSPVPIPERPRDTRPRIASHSKADCAPFRQAGPPDLRLVETPAPDDLDPPLTQWKKPWERQGAGPADSNWPTVQIPTRLLDPPRRIEAIAALPDQPPVAFTWRRHRYRIRRADGPERIYGEWWRYDREVSSVRDYFRVEDDTGRRFWLFREGNGLDTQTGDLSWFLHGLF